MNNGSVVPQPDRRVVPWEAQTNRHSWDQEQGLRPVPANFIDEPAPPPGIAARLFPRLTNDPIQNGKLIIEAFVDCHRQGVEPNVIRYQLEQRGIDHAILNAAATRAGKLWEKERPPDPGPAIVQKPNGLHQAAETPTAPAKLESAKASSYKVAGIRWFWLNRFALGKLGLIGGLPDRGKGLLTSDMISRATKGSPWPCNEGRAIKGNALLLTAEDDIEDTVVPRLLAAGADLDRVEIIRMVNGGATRRMFSLVTDLALLRQKIEEVGNVVLIVIDPISAYLGVGKVDARQSTDVRGVLAPLVELAAEKKLLIVGVMHFNKKEDVTNAMLRIADSLAFVAASRHCYVVLDDHENNRRLFVKAKNNLAPDMHALSYTIDTVLVGKDETGSIYAPRVIWGAEHVNVTASEAMQAEADAGKSAQQSGSKNAAMKFLADILAMGPMAKTDIEDAAKGNGISERTLFRAKADLDVVAKKDGMKGGWIWSMPKRSIRRPNGAD